jgi:HAD superfamily hydrolase (TIGR01549 family)
MRLPEPAGDRLGRQHDPELAPMPIDTDRIEALCFDVDGTLRDTDDQLVLRLSRYLRWVGFFFPKRDPQPFARKMIMAIENPGNLLLGLPDRLGFDHYLAAASEHLSYLRPRNKAHNFLIIPGVKEMLARLYPHYPMAVISARDERNTLHFLEHFGLGAYFKTIVTAQTCRHTKPYPDPVLYAAREMDVLPENSLMIGDTVVDIRSGRSAGAQTLGVLCGFGEEPELRRAGADQILPNTPDLLNLPGIRSD